MDHPTQAGSALGFTPAVGDMPLTPKQRSLLSLASELGRTKFAPRASQWDESASFPFANYDNLREAGLLRLCVPEAHGGLGADYPTYMMLAAEIGRHCGATALTWNMHICSMPPTPRVSLPHLRRTKPPAISATATSSGCIRSRPAVSRCRACTDRP
ncbi:MAG: acyl-CoA dehydrogenase family protein, partial [Betaproteobacteria bacterium]|nr:acyl-CoA dehydrogenase family protein [Betaproteobacteria bacterium]